jgi:hypothetical protein
MERVLEHDLRCENLGFSVMIFSDRGQTSERHTVTRRVSPITSAPFTPPPLLCRWGAARCPGPHVRVAGIPGLRLSPVFAGQRVDHLCQLNPLVSRGPIRQAQRISPRPQA